jgi:acetolactate synthase I/II/III large subunit
MSLDYIDNLVTCLKNEGVKYAFGVTGGGKSLELISKLVANDISYYPVAHEAAAAIMAGACCRDGKTRAVAISIKGPGFVNLVPGILLNHYEGRPALTISEAYGDSTPEYRMHKRAGHYEMISTYVKGYQKVGDTTDGIKKLFAIAQSECPGPVHLDLCNKPVTSDVTVKKGTEYLGSTQSQDTSEVYALIKTAERPAVIFGSCMSRNVDGNIFEGLQVPVVTTAAAKGYFDEFNEYSGGIITGEIKQLSPEETILKKADLIIAFGLRNTEVIVPGKFLQPLIIFDRIDEDLHDGFDADICYTGSNMIEIAEEVRGLLQEKQWGKDIVQGHRAAIEKELFVDEWLPAVVFRSLERGVGNDPVLCIDTGLFCTIGETVWKAATPHNFCGSSNSRFMGTALPTAIGIACMDKTRTVICVAGDGGMTPYLNEIKTAVYNKLPIIFVLMSDGGYGTVAASSNDKRIPKDIFTINDPVLYRAVEGLGCRSVYVKDIEGFEKTLEDYDHSKGPIFIETRFEANRYMEMAKNLR